VTSVDRTLLRKFCARLYIYLLAYQTLLRPLPLTSSLSGLYIPSEGLNLPCLDSEIIGCCSCVQSFTELTEWSHICRVRVLAWMASLPITSLARCVLSKAEVSLGYDMFSHIWPTAMRLNKNTVSQARRVTTLISSRSSLTYLTCGVPRRPDVRKADGREISFIAA